MSGRRAAKSKSLKRKVENDLRELDREEQVMNIVHGSTTSNIAGAPQLPMPTLALHFSSESSNDTNADIIPENICVLNTARSMSSKDFSDSNVSTTIEDLNVAGTTSEGIRVNCQTSCEESLGDDNFLNDEYFLSSDEVELSIDGLNDEDGNNGPIHDQVECPLPLKDKLRKWAQQFNIRHNALSALLKIIKNEQHPELPTDSRTLLGTARNAHVTVLDAESQMCYFGVANELKKLDLRKFCCDEHIHLKVNIDGLPICKSTGTQFWPILCQVVSDTKTSPVIVACYYGNTKPKSVDEFLEKFVTEVQALEATGFNSHGTQYRISIHSIICDAPARAFVKCVKGHNGYYGCEKCIQKGASVNRRITFLDSEAEKRTDCSFLEQVQKEHHLGVSPLSRLNVGLVSQVPIDSMHLVHLGVMRKVLLLLMRLGERTVKIGSHQIAMISEKLVALRNNIPTEFSRKPRSLKDIDRFKATEFRQIILYTGPIVFRNILPKHIYEHFLILHVAISILSNPVQASDNVQIDYAENLLKLFVQDMERIYGAQSVIYNVHNLIHLPDDVRKFGTLDNINCFPFENRLGEIKNILRTTPNQLAQLSRRMSERDDSISQKNNSVNFALRRSHNDGPCLNIQGEQFKEAIFDEWKLNTCLQRDCYFKTRHNKILKLVNIIKPFGNTQLKDVWIVYQDCPIIDDYYIYPCKSSVTSIFKISRPTNNLLVGKLTCLHKKCIVNLDFKVAVAINHTIF